MNCLQRSTVLTTRMTTRRRFLGGTVAVFAAPYVISSTALGTQTQLPPSQRIVMGAVGLGARGRHVMDSFLANRGVQMVAVCDVQNERRESARAAVNQKYETRIARPTAIFATCWPKMILMRL